MHALLQTTSLNLTRRAGRSAGALLLATVSVLIVAPTALAHPDVERGSDLAMEAEFEQAVEAFDAALSSGSMTRDDLIMLLQERALVHQALGNERKLLQDLAYLAALDPTHELGERAPPRLVERWSTIAVATAALSLTAEATGVPGGLKITADMEGAPKSERPTIRISVRPVGGEWQSVETQSTEYPAPSGGELEYFVEAVGLGGVVLASVGSADMPEASEAIALAGGGAAAGAADLDDGDQNWAQKNKWWLIGGAGAAVVLATVIGVVAAGGSSEGPSQQTQGMPAIMGW